MCVYQITIFTAVKIWTIKIYHGKNLDGKNTFSSRSESKNYEGILKWLLSEINRALTLFSVAWKKGVRFNWTYFLLAFRDILRENIRFVANSSIFATWQLNLSFLQIKKNTTKGPIDEPCHLARSHVPFFDFYLIFVLLCISVENSFIDRTYHH